MKFCADATGRISDLDNVKTSTMVFESVSYPWWPFFQFFFSRFDFDSTTMLTINDPGLCMVRLSERTSPFLLKHGRAVKPVVDDNCWT